MTSRALFRCAALAWALAPSTAAALPIELGAQAPATLSVDDATRAGGVGLALEVGTPLLDRPLGTAGQLLLQFGAGALVGAGVAWALEPGAIYRFAPSGSWAPSTGLSLLWLTGDLVRTIDQRGRLAGDPLALRLGVSPLRFLVEDGWISVLGLRIGPTLFHGGRPPLSFSLILFELGTEL